MGTPAKDKLSLHARDVTRQKVLELDDVPREATIGALVQSLVQEMDLPENNASGEPVAYHGRLEREGRHLNASEVVGDVLQPNDQIVLHPDIVAG